MGACLTKLKTRNKRNKRASDKSYSLSLPMFASNRTRHLGSGAVRLERRRPCDDAARDSLHVFKRFISISSIYYYFDACSHEKEM